MLDFLKTTAGVAVFSVAAIVILLLIIELNYKFFTKLVLDFIFALICTVLCSPVLIVCAVLSKKSGNGSILERQPFLGKSGKVIFLHTFSGVESCVKYTARLFDILTGKLSFVGVKPLCVEDGALLDDTLLDRFNARPGIISHLSVSGDKDLSYEEMFTLDIRYSKRRGFFYDIWIALMAAVLFCRGEGKSYLGETLNASFTETLLSRGVITEEEVVRAREYAAEAVSDAEKAIKFKKIGRAHV